MPCHVGAAQGGAAGAAGLPEALAGGECTLVSRLPLILQPGAASQVVIQLPFILEPGAASHILLYQFKAFGLSLCIC